VISQTRTPPPGADATAIERFFEDEACALARAIAATGHAGDSVAQEERDRLFRTETATTWSVGRLVAVLTSGCAADRPQWPPRDPCNARRGSGRCASGSRGAPLPSPCCRPLGWPRPRTREPRDGGDRARARAGNA